MRILRWSARLFLAPTLPFALLLAAAGETAAGRIAGACWILVAIAPWLHRAYAIPTFGAGAIAWCLLSAITPRDRSADVGFGSRWLSGLPFRAAPSRIVPEIDQLKLGAWIVAFMDPIVDGGEGAEIRRVFMERYRELEHDPQFSSAEPALGETYAELFGLGPRASAHCLRYVPLNAGKPPMIFLHGSLGNFAGFYWVLKPFSDSVGIPIIGPTFGAGNWLKDGGFETVADAPERCGRDLIKPANGYVLAGLSNGGLGVMEAAIRMPERYRALIFISAVVSSQWLLDPRFIERWGKKPIFFLHGRNDDRVPAELIEIVAAGLREHGVPVRVSIVEGQDHFQMFGDPKGTERTITEWVRSLDAPPAPEEHG